MISKNTEEIYSRELNRMINKLDINFNEYNQKNFIDLIINKYKENKVPFQNLQQGLYAVNHYFQRIGKDKPLDLPKDYIDKLQVEYQEQIPVREARPTTIAWETIQTKCKAFLKDEKNDAHDRLILALYLLIPARRSEYYSLKWGNAKAGENRLSTTGTLAIDDYKTVKTYGIFTIDLFEPSLLLLKRDATLFKQIINAIEKKTDDELIFQTAGKGYSIISFATRARNLFSKLLGEKLGLLDIRRAYEEFIRRTILNNAKLSLKKRAEYKAALELATGHSNATQNKYADKLEIVN